MVADIAAAMEVRVVADMETSIGGGQGGRRKKIGYPIWQEEEEGYPIWQEE